MKPLKKKKNKNMMEKDLFGDIIQESKRLGFNESISEKGASEEEEDVLDRIYGQ